MTRVATLAVLLALTPALARAQVPDSTGTVIVAVSAGGQPAPDALVRAGRVQASTGESGRAALRLVAGLRTIVVTRLGFHADTLRVLVVAGRDTTLALSLEDEAEELEAITVTTTRALRHIEDEPVRVEVLAGDDVGEKTQMRPQDLTNFVAEMSGVRIQPTAPGRGGAAIRIQGLAGQYTQVLNDGLPLGGSRPDGLVLLQMPPLDLTQVEVIKGAATALYGPAALGGVMNLVSRRPDNQTEVLVSGRPRGGADGFLWTSSRLTDRLGYTLIADAHGQSARDLDHDGWADLPGYERVNLRPRLFWTGERGASVLATVGVMGENRDGGTIDGGTAPDGQPYEAGVNTRRLDGGAIGHWPLRGSLQATARVAASLVSRDHRFGIVRERDDAGTLFGEASLSAGTERLNGLVGVAYDRSSYANEDVPRHDYTFTTPSVFGQVTWTPRHAVSASLSGRCDDHSRYGTICSPRVSVLWRAVEDWSLRASAGTGFFAPTLFVDRSDVTGLGAVGPMGGVAAERGRNASLDLSGKFGITDVTVTLFANEVRRPFALIESPPVCLSCFPLQPATLPGPTRTTGGEVFVTYEGDPIVVTAFYAYLHATEVDAITGQRHRSPYNPEHNLFVDITWEGRGGLWIALEAAWVGKQALEDDPFRTVSREYTNVEFLVSKRFGRAQLFANADNLTNVRQSRYAPMLRPAPRPGGLPWTVGQWGPVEGRILSAGVRYRLR